MHMSACIWAVRIKTTPSWIWFLHRKMPKERNIKKQEINVNGGRAAAVFDEEQKGRTALASR